MGEPLFSRFTRLLEVHPAVPSLRQPRFQPLVLAARIADLRKVGRHVAREIGASGGTHNVAGETRATARPVSHQLGTFLRIAGNRTGDLARFFRRRRRRQIAERIVFRVVARGPTGITFPRALRRIAFGVERHLYGPVRQC